MNPEENPPVETVQEQTPNPNGIWLMVCPIVFSVLVCMNVAGSLSDKGALSLIYGVGAAAVTFVVMLFLTASLARKYQTGQAGLGRCLGWQVCEGFGINVIFLALFCNTMSSGEAMAVGIGIIGFGVGLIRWAFDANHPKRQKVALIITIPLLVWLFLDMAYILYRDFAG